jgi:hypothetical protein
MPIVIAPAAPMSQGISQAYGGLQQYMQDRDYYLKSNQLNLQAQQQMRQAQQQQFEQQLRLAQFQSSLYPSQRDVWLGAMQQQNQAAQFDQQQALSDQRFQQQQQLSQLELSQGEQLRLQKLKQQESSIDEMYSNGQFTQEEANALKFQVRTQINPLQSRMDQMRIQQQDMQTKAMKEGLAQQEISGQEAAVFRSKSLQDRIATVTDPVSGEDSSWFEQSPGKWAPLAQPRPESTKGKIDDANYTKIYLDVAKMVAGMKTDMGSAYAPEKQAEMVGKILEQMGLAPNLQQQRQMMAQGASGANAPQGTQQQPSPQSEIQQIQQARQDNPPFDPGKPETATAAQRDSMGKLDELEQLAQDYRGENSQEVLEAVRQAKATFARYGSVGGMPRWDRTVYLNRLNYALTMLRSASANEQPAVRGSSERPAYQYRPTSREGRR